MEYKANYAIVGAFVALVLAGFMGFVYWFAIADASLPRTSYAVVFDGAANGLTPGTQVLFNGLPVGTVQQVGINPQNPAQVFATVAVDAEAPVMTDTRAVLEVQPLTGMATIQLLGGTLAAGRLVPAAGEDVAVLYGQASDFQLILEGARDVMVSADATLSRIESFFAANEAQLSSTLASIDELTGGLATLLGGAGVGDEFGSVLEGLTETLASIQTTAAGLETLVTDNSESLTSAITNAEIFAAALASNADSIDGFLASITSTSDQIGPLAGELQALSAEVRGIVTALPAEAVSGIVEDVSVFAQTLASNTDNIEAFFEDARMLAGNLAGVSEGLQSTLDLIDAASVAIDPDVIARALDNIEAFSAALGDNTENVGEILANTRVLSETLSSASIRVESIIDRVDAMITTEDGRMLFSELGAAAGSIRRLADNLDGLVASEDTGSLFANVGAAAIAIENLANELDARTLAITTGITGFTNSGLGAYSTLANEAIRTLDQLNRVLRQIERNPQVLIFGGETMREFRP